YAPARVLFRVLQNSRSINVVPPSAADINPMHFIVNGHQLDSISEATIISAVDGLRLFEIPEDLRRANEQAGIDRIVIPQIFPDGGHLVSVGLNLHRVLQIDNRMELAIYGDVEQTGLKVFKQAIDDGVIKNMIAHREEKRCADVTCGRKKRDAVLFPPIAI